MDLRAEFDHIAEELEWGELASTLQAAIFDILVDRANPPRPPPVPAELIVNPQPAVGQGGPYCGYIPLGADPDMMAALTMNQGLLCPEKVLQPGQLCSQAGVYSQGQYLPYQWPVDIITAAAVHPYRDLPVFMFPGGVEQILHPVVALNGHMFYTIPAEVFAPVVSAAPPVNTTNSEERKCYSQQDDGQAYVKKPLNAFMLYMKEQRPNVEANIKSRGNAAVNVVLGQRWKSMTREEQAKYYNKAKEERLLHALRYPNWSSGHNYGKKRKRGSRRKAPIKAEGVMEPHPLQTVLMRTQAAVNAPVWNMRHLPQVSELGPASWPDVARTASTSLAFHAPLPQAPDDWTPEEGLRELLEEFLPPTTPQPQLPFTPHADLWTVDVNQI